MNGHPRGCTCSTCRPIGRMADVIMGKPSRSEQSRARRIEEADKAAAERYARLTQNDGETSE